MFQSKQINGLFYFYMGVLLLIQIATSKISQRFPVVPYSWRLRIIYQTRQQIHFTEQNGSVFRKLPSIRRQMHVLMKDVSMKDWLSNNRTLNHLFRTYQKCTRGRDVLNAPCLKVDDAYEGYFNSMQFIYNLQFVSLFYYEFPSIYTYSKYKRKFVDKYLILWKLFNLQVNRSRKPDQLIIKLLKR